MTVANVTQPKAVLITVNVFAVYNHMLNKTVGSDMDIQKIISKFDIGYTANTLTVLSTAFGCVTFATVIWLYTKQLTAVRSQWL